jgi:hypothetical protein
MLMAFSTTRVRIHSYLLIAVTLFQIHPRVTTLFNLNLATKSSVSLTYDIHHSGGSTCTTSIDIIPKTYACSYYSSRQHTYNLYKTVQCQRTGSYKTHSFSAKVKITHWNDYDQKCSDQLVQLKLLQNKCYL